MSCMGYQELPVNCLMWFLALMPAAPFVKPPPARPLWHFLGCQRTSAWPCFALGLVRGGSHIHNCTEWQSVWRPVGERASGGGGTWGQALHLIKHGADYRSLLSACHLSAAHPLHPGLLQEVMDCEKLISPDLGALSQGWCETAETVVCFPLITTLNQQPSTLPFSTSHLILSGFYHYLYSFCTFSGIPQRNMRL